MAASARTRAVSSARFLFFFFFYFTWRERFIGILIIITILQRRDSKAIFIMHVRCFDYTVVLEGNAAVRVGRGRWVALD